MASLQVGVSVQHSYTVGAAVTAAALAERHAVPGLSLPAVWSTPDMIAAMEIACAALVADLLAPGQISVGVSNDVRHLAATPVGIHVRVRATLAEIEARKLTFAVEAHDSAEKVGEGTHVRYIVDRARFEARVAEKRRTGTVTE